MGVPGGEEVKIHLPTRVGRWTDRFGGVPDRSTASQIRALVIWVAGVEGRGPVLSMLAGRAVKDGKSA